jgi:cation diffusion facilitator family transporter
MVQVYDGHHDKGIAPVNAPAELAVGVAARSYGPMPDNLAAHHAATRERARLSARYVVRGIGLNLVLAVVKFAGGLFGHTYALMADGTESMLDVLASLLAWVGVRVAGRPPDANHPYGHGRAEPISVLVIAGLTFPSAGWVAWSAIQGILAPHPGPHWETLPLLVAVVLVKTWFSWRVSAAGETVGSTALGAEAWRHGSDALSSAAAFVGISIAVIGGPKWRSADSWAALFTCAIMIFNGVVVLREALEEVMDAAVPTTLENEVRAIAAAVMGVKALDKCRVRKSGLSYLVDIQVRVDGDLSVRAGHEIAHAVRSALLASPLRVSDVSVHVEPMG